MPRKGRRIAKGTLIPAARRGAMAFPAMPFKAERGSTYAGQTFKEGSTVSAVLEIERAVSQLPPKELAHFREWFEEFDAKIWDRQFEEDAKSGKLDKLANQAIADFRAGKYEERGWHHARRIRFHGWGARQTLSCHAGWVHNYYTKQTAQPSSKR
jgi:hypothetical protein